MNEHDRYLNMGIVPPGSYNAITTPEGRIIVMNPYGNDFEVSSVYSHPRNVANKPSRRKRKEQLQKQISYAYDELARLDRFPEDNFDDGTVITFVKTFTIWEQGAKRYSYAALKWDGKWYTTGPKSPKAYTWDELCAWFVEEGDVENIRVVSNSRPLIPVDSSKTPF